MLDACDQSHKWPGSSTVCAAKRVAESLGGCAGHRLRHEQANNGAPMLSCWNSLASRPLAVVMYPLFAFTLTDSIERRQIDSLYFAASAPRAGARCSPRPAGDGWPRLADDESPCWAALPQDDERDDEDSPEKLSPGLAPTRAFGGLTPRPNVPTAQKICSLARW